MLLGLEDKNENIRHINELKKAADLVGFHGAAVWVHGAMRDTMSGRGGPWEISPKRLPYQWSCFVITFALSLTLFCENKCIYLWQIFWEDKLQLLSNQSQEEIKDLPKIFLRQTAHPLYVGSLTGCELNFTFGIEYIFNFHCFTIYTHCKYCSDLVLKPVKWSLRLTQEEDNPSRLC